MDASKVIGAYEIRNVSLYQALFAEFFATMILVFTGVGSTSDFLPPSELITALCFGFTASTLVLSFGHISGCQMNPAVTIGLMIVGETPILRGIGYILMQLIGSAVGAGIIIGFLKHENDIGITRLANSELNAGQGIFVEGMLTFLLLLVILSVIDKNRTSFKCTSPIAVGLAIATGHLAGIRFTGASMNPARSFGPALVHTDARGNYIYWIGPIIGAIMASLIYRIVMKPWNRSSTTDTTEVCTYYPYDDSF